MIAFAWNFKLRKKNSGSLCVFSSTSRALLPGKNYAPCLGICLENLYYSAHAVSNATLFTTVLNYYAFLYPLFYHIHNRVDLLILQKKKKKKKKKLQNEYKHPQNKPTSYNISLTCCPALPRAPSGPSGPCTSNTKQNINQWECKVERKLGKYSRIRWTEVFIKLSSMIP